MNIDRPDPDTLLHRVQSEEAQAQRGHLKIFFGASAGVGKTYAMLSAAHQAKARGVVLAVGIVETHGRAETQAVLNHLPRLPMKQIEYRDNLIDEFDLDGALAFANEHPKALILVDELAHSNAAGSRHPRRWQDVEELLEAGIDVWTTMNVQHLESLNDIVSGITGIRVWETVPDHVFDKADEVVVVDLPPDELIERLRQGKVYLPQQAELATRNFFRKGNLLALRELALRRTADRVDGEMQAYRLQSAVAPVWPNRESLLACVGTGADGEKVIRRCARLASNLGVSWHAVHVELYRANSTDEAIDRALRTLKLAEELGAVTATVTSAELAPALVRYAREHNLSRIVIGRSTKKWPWQRSLYQTIAKQADDLDILHIATHHNETPPTALSSHGFNPTIRWNGYIAAVAACIGTAIAATPLHGVFELTNIVMLFLLAVVVVALRYGRGPAVLAAFVGVGLFDFFFVPPRFSFAVSDVQYLVTFTVMLIVALVVGQLMAGLKGQAEVATKRERRMRALYEMSRDLSAALVPEQVADISAQFIRTEFNASSVLLIADEQDQLRAVSNSAIEFDMGIAQWAFDHGEPVGHGTDTLSASKHLVIPLKATMRLRGVLVIEPSSVRLNNPDRRRVLQTCASLLAISIERIHYIDVAQRTTMQMESERLRNSLLSAISHDLRTPLTALVGLADTLEITTPPSSTQQREITAAIRQSALRMNALVNNLLDMARLESGSVQLNCQWQPIEDVIGSALSACKQLLNGRPITTHLPDDLPLLHIDAVLIERVLVNLLENAAKYTPSNTGIEIEGTIENNEVLITIADHGPGLPKGKEVLIFDKFERGKKESATPGVGLGLAICKAIMQVHNGRIEGKTRPAGGAAFTLALPCGTPPTENGALHKELSE